MVTLEPGTHHHYHFSGADDMEVMNGFHGWQSSRPVKERFRWDPEYEGRLLRVKIRGSSVLVRFTGLDRSFG